MKNDAPLCADKQNLLLIFLKRHHSNRHKGGIQMCCSLESSLDDDLSLYVSLILLFCSYFTLLLLLLWRGIYGDQYSSSSLSLTLSPCLVHSALLKENRHYDVSPAKHSKKSQRRERQRGRKKRQSKAESEVKIV